MANPAKITDRDSLMNQIEDHANRSDIDDEGVSDLVIQLAEFHLNRELRHPKMLDRDDSFTIDAQYKTAPTGFLEPRRIVLDRSPPCELKFVTMEDLASLKPRFSDAGVPIYYAVTGLDDTDGVALEFLPIPSSAETGLVVYYREIPALTASNTTNWLLTTAPDLYLDTCLYELYDYLRDDEQADRYQRRRDAKIASLNKAGGRMKSRTARPVIRAIGG